MSNDPAEHDTPVDRNGPDLIELEQRAVRWWQPLAVLLVLVLLFLLGDRLGLRGAVSELRAWVDSLGILGPVVFVAAYLLLTMLGFPSSPLTAAAGALFGAALGLALALAAATAAMLGGFLAARHLAPEYLRQRLRTTRGFQRVDRLVQRRPVPVLVTVRLVSILPFAVVNYGFGLTRVPFRTYAIWSIVGKVPGTVVLVVGIDAIVDVLYSDRVPWGSIALVLLVAVALAAALRTMKRRLKEMEKDDA